jgi:hypothetical protein
LRFEANFLLISAKLIGGQNLSGGTESNSWSAQTTLMRCICGCQASDGTPGATEKAGGKGKTGLTVLLLRGLFSLLGALIRAATTLARISNGIAIHWSS